MQLGPENHLQSTEVLAKVSLPHNAVLDTATLVYTQLLSDLTRFQTLDGLCSDQISSGRHQKRYKYRVQQPIELQAIHIDD